MDYKSEERKGRCLECGDVLPYGSRSDMKFCSGSCKSRYHYHVDGRNKRIRLKTINALDRNYGILSSLLEEKVTSIEIPDLAQKGYNFSCFTFWRRVRNHNEYRCFDIKYFMSENRVFGLEKVR